MKCTNTFCALYNKKSGDNCSVGVVLYNVKDCPERKKHEKVIIKIRSLIRYYKNGYKEKLQELLRLFYINGKGEGMEKKEEYRVESFQSGTTWIMNSDDTCKLHIGFWVDENVDRDLLIHDRGTAEKGRFAQALCTMLNDICNSRAENSKDYLCSMYAGRMDVQDSKIIFYDAYMGKLEVDCFIVNLNGWEEVTIPDKVKQDLQDGFDRTVECHRSNKG